MATPRPSSWQPPSQWGAVGKVDVRWPNCIVLPRATSPVGVAGPHSLRCRHRPCLVRHHGSHCCCRQRRRCSPPSMVGCCVAYSVVCRPICYSPLSSSCDCQLFRRRPPSSIADLRQPLFYRSCPSHPSPSPLPSMVGCCVLRPPSSIPTEPPS